VTYQDEQRHLRQSSGESFDCSPAADQNGPK